MNKIYIPQVEHFIWCDISAGNLQPFIPKTLRRKLFDTLHSISHPGIKATCRLISKKYLAGNQQGYQGLDTPFCSLSKSQNSETH